ncbi:MAG: hypothetical protein KatS3mg060_3693 [Dehalococcoidia bacterium]|nr:MAG: hypothetical protein KatS3mg060_3693 [Dehalococcoidia bacterium]
MTLAGAGRSLQVATIARPLARRPAAWLGVAATYGLFSLFLTYPVGLDLANGVPDFGDPLVMVWYLGWYAQAIPGNLAGLFNAPFFFPHRDVLLFHDHLLAQGLVAWPVVRLTGNPVLAANLLTLLSFTLAGLGGYLLTRRFTGSVLAAFLVGLAIAFSPFRIAHISHLNLLWLHWLPFVLLGLERLLTGRRWRDALLLALVANLLVLSSYNFAPLVAVSVAVWIVVRIATDRTLWSGRWLRLGAQLGFVAAVTLALNLPLTLRYFSVSERLGFTRSADEVRAYSASLTDYLAVPPSNLLLGGLLAPFRSVDWSERSLFPGLIVLIFAVVGAGVSLSQRGQKRSVALALLAVAGVMVLLSFGLSPTQPPGLRWYPWLYEHVPGLAGLRAPARAGGIVQIMLAVLAGVGLATFFGAVRHRAGRWVPPALAALVGLLLVAESASYPSSYAVPVWLGEGAVGRSTDDYPALGRNPLGIPPAPTAVDDWLAAAPEPGAVAVLPMLLHTERAWLESVRMLAALRHGRPIVNGTSAYRPADLVALSRELAERPTPETFGALRERGVRYVVVRRASLGAAERARLDGALPGLPLVEEARFGDDLVYRLVDRAP